MTDSPLYEETVRLSEVIVFERKKLLIKRAHVALYGDRITVKGPKGETLVLPFSALGGISALGRKKINIYFEKRVYQLKGDASFNGLKYVHLYYRYKNISKGDYDGKFLGI